MTDDAKKVFISYRRALSIDLAGRVHDNLVARGYDVFFDISSIASGEFGRLILHQIEARPLFVPVLVPGCFDKTAELDDWFRREIEHALARKRHIVPLVAKGFTFEKAAGGKGKTLPGRLGELVKYHYIDVPETYFTEAMNKLTAGLAALPADVDVQPTPALERSTIQRMRDAAKIARPDAGGTRWVFPSRAELSIPLEAPKLESADATFLGNRLSWNAIIGASGYIVERSFDSLFSAPVQVYDDDQTSFVDEAAKADVLTTLAFTPERHYRVKAKGNLLFSDSPWSNVVELRPLWRPSVVTLPALRLQYNPLSLIGRRFTWSAAERAERYVLEKCSDLLFSKPEKIYEGKELEFTDVTGVDRPRAPSSDDFYRVKATGGLFALDSPWSNVVKVGAFPFKIG